MACPARFKAFFQHQTQCFVQGVIHSDGRGVMIRAGTFAPIIGEEINVEVPTLDGRFTRSDGGHGSRAEGDRRKPRRAAEAFLGAAIEGIHPPVIHAHRAASKGSDGVQQQ